MPQFDTEVDGLLRIDIGTGEVLFQWKSVLVHSEYSLDSLTFVSLA